MTKLNGWLVLILSVEEGTEYSVTMQQGVGPKVKDLNSLFTA